MKKLKYEFHSELSRSLSISNSRANNQTPSNDGYIDYEATTHLKNRYGYFFYESIRFQTRNNLPIDINNKIY